MNINFDVIKSCLNNEFQFVVVQTGMFCGHAVKILNQDLTHIRQDARLAGAAIVMSNLAFIEIAHLIASLADRCITKMFGSATEWSENGIIVNSVAVAGVATSTLVGLNIALYKGLKSPLTPLATLAISTATCTIYILARLSSVNVKGS